MKKILWAALSFLLVFQTVAIAQNVNEYLITYDIGAYRKITSGGPTGSILAGVDHFGLEHSDTALGIVYVNDAQKMWVDVKVTQHTGGDSDRWLLHELDAEFRNYYGIPDLSYTVKTIDGNRILVDATGGRDYRWISGNKIIRIEYNDLQMTKPQPLEVIQAYLAKHPSGIIPFTLKELRNNANVTKWIKDEMTRRLWLCDKWHMQYQAGSVTQADLLPKLLESMIIFLNYRQKYFNISVEDERNALRSYLQNSNTSGFQTKLTEYKTWWGANKTKSILL